MENLDKYYLNRWLKKKDWSQIGTTKKIRLFNLIKFIENCQIDIGDANLIDYGCGSGWLFSHLHELGFLNLYGYDVTPSTLAVVKEKYPFVKKLWGREGDLFEKIPSNIFDMCTSIEVIEHVPKELKLDVLCEINRILKPGGYLYLTTPNGKYFKKGITEEEMQPIEEWLTPKEMRKLLYKSGFKLLSYGSIRIDRDLTLFHRFLLSIRLVKLLKFLGLHKQYMNLLGCRMMGLSMYFFAQKK